MYQRKFTLREIEYTLTRPDLGGWHVNREDPFDLIYVSSPSSNWANRKDNITTAYKPTSQGPKEIQIEISKIETRYEFYPGRNLRGDPAGILAHTDGVDNDCIMAYWRNVFSFRKTRDRSLLPEMKKSFKKRISSKKLINAVEVTIRELIRTGEDGSIAEGSDPAEDTRPHYGVCLSNQQITREAPDYVR